MRRSTEKLFRRVVGIGSAAALMCGVEVIAGLAAAYGLGGRPRTDGDPPERLRKVIINHIRRASTASAPRTRNSGAPSPTRCAPALYVPTNLSTRWHGASEHRATTIPL